VIDLRVDDHERPIEELRRLYGLHEQLFGKTPGKDWLEVDTELRAEIRERLGRLGYKSLAEWAGVENLEEARGRGRHGRSRRARGAEEAKWLSTTSYTSTRSSAPRTWAAI
jgi:uncharacterized Ntn-hydrolase superfamily protein